MKLEDAPVGLFKYGDTLALKTEYYNQQHNGEYKPECYIIKSGEYFCGGASSVEEFNNLDVKPMGCCEDCINFLNNHICLHWSKYGTIEVNPNDFCSYFESLI